jgi:hypothetical protein
MSANEQLGFVLEVARLLVEPEHLPVIDQAQFACKHVNEKCRRVAVLAPFNRGKSTLLNALLGNATLPLGLVPTTGTAIRIRYGSKFSVCITFREGQTLWGDIDLLKQYAVLEEGKQQKDVVSIEVLCPAPLLEGDVELVDLPGTNDDDAQDALTFNELLRADLVIQVLDARQLFTLTEKMQTQQWLVERGIHSFLFVVNFLNLLEESERSGVWKRAQALSAGYQALYAVDALPALKARMHNDLNGIAESGLDSFEAALGNFFRASTQTLHKLRMQRVASQVGLVSEVLSTKAKCIEKEVDELLDEQRQANMVLRYQLEICERVLDQTMTECREWLKPSSIVPFHTPALAKAIRRGRFDAWCNEYLVGTLEQRFQDLRNCLIGLSKYGSKKLPQFKLPQIIQPTPSLPNRSQTGSSTNVKGSAAAAGVVALMLGGPIAIAAAAAAATGYLVNKKNREAQQLKETNFEEAVVAAYIDAVSNFLRGYSRTALSAIAEYEGATKKFLRSCTVNEPSILNAKCQQIAELTNVIDNLTSGVSLLDAEYR